MLTTPDPRMCGVCFTPLEARFDGLGLWTPVYTHPEREPWDHDPKPVPVDDRVIRTCDFCEHTPGATAFLTRKAIVGLTPTGETEIWAEPWSACAICAKHIRSRAVHLLMDRAVAMARHPETGGPLDRPTRRVLRREHIKPLFMKFFAAEPSEVSGEKGYLK
ncbi:hypothetical protein QZH56_30345 [Streptomyces olivoreticuli]|uniref:hypothetical protein n=1 Tax=Streptomyces olivoreticuli TaxID=68246 RepID=UPI002659E9FA|nr:hypothetical protein [Streptomyces olivoreticuli]WKK23005.1 hypothetical protein QZH56_30345 [Streptomyces olivoreticuli]